jgi:predicted nucleotidyltransferase
MSRARIPIPKAKITDFCHRNRVKSLALFGSVLRADFRPESDIDILVEFEPEARIGFMALGRMQRELTAVLEYQVDLVLPISWRNPANRSRLHFCTIGQQELLAACQDLTSSRTFDSTVN